MSIAAIVSSLAFTMVAGAGVRSFWIADLWNDANGQSIGLFGGRLTYEHPLSPRFVPSGHISINANMMAPSPHIITDAMWGFRARKYSIRSSINPAEVDKFFLVAAPLWPLLLLLFIAPAR